LALASHPGLGTTFSIYLPAVKEPRERSSQNHLSQRLTRNETILLVEDEDPVREVNALLLESLGYRVLQVSDAEEALKLGQNEQMKIDLLFTDVIMPGMSGRELAEAFCVLHPNIKILFQSGYTDDIVFATVFYKPKCLSCKNHSASTVWRRRFATFSIRDKM